MVEMRNINRSIWFHVSTNYSPVREIDFRAWPKDRNVRNAFEETLSTLFIRRFHRGKKQIIDYRFRAGSIIGILALRQELAARSFTESRQIPRVARSVNAFERMFLAGERIRRRCRITSAINFNNLTYELHRDKFISLSLSPYCVAFSGFLASLNEIKETWRAS